jgi:hypothetical protein
MIASGGLGNLDDADVELSTVGDVQALGLDRSGELVLSQVVVLRQTVLDLLRKLDERLQSMERSLSATVGENALHAQPPAKREVGGARAEDGSVFEESDGGERETGEGSDVDYVDEPGRDDEDLAAEDD